MFNNLGVPIDRTGVFAFTKLLWPLVVIPRAVHVDCGK